MRTIGIVSSKEESIYVLSIAIRTWSPFHFVRSATRQRSQNRNSCILLYKEGNKQKIGEG